MKTLNIKIQDKTFRISIRKFLKIILIKQKEENIYFKPPQRPFFYLLLYNKLACLGTLCDVITQVYPAQTYVIKNIIYGSSEPDVLRDIIVRYNNQVNDIINWTKDNEDYIQTVIQEIQEGKYEQK